MGREIQQYKTSRVCAQREVLPIWMYSRLLYSTLPVPEADDVHVGQIAGTSKASVLRYEMITMVLMTILRNNFCSHSILCCIFSEGLTIISAFWACTKIFLSMKFIHYLLLAVFIIHFFFFLGFKLFLFSHKD